MQDILESRRGSPGPSQQGPAYAENDFYPSSSNVKRLPELWMAAAVSAKNIDTKKSDYFSLLRKTLILTFSPEWTGYKRKVDLRSAFQYYHRLNKTITKNVSEIYHAALVIFKRDPWSNSYFSWKDLFGKTVEFHDKNVQDYFKSEPEDIVLARVHALYLQNKLSAAMCLAKTSFLYHSRIAQSFRSARKRVSPTEFSTSGHASIDWFFSILQKASLDSIVVEVQKLSCHEKVEILYRLWRKEKNKPFCYSLLHICIIQDLIQPSKNCCTERFFKIFCIMHEELHSSPKEIAESCHEVFSKNAPSSAHFYLLVDVLWRHFGIKCVDLYVNMYVRGLTADINHLESKRNLGAHSEAGYLETRISIVFSRLSRIFKNLNPVVARECMFSAFSVRPTEERLFELEGLSRSLSITNKNIHRSLLPTFTHPLLSDSIGNISRGVIMDLITVLENVRCVTFRYNVFNWQHNIRDLGNYLNSYSRLATLEGAESVTDSDDELSESDMGNAKAVLNPTNALECQFQQSSIKRKNHSGCSGKINQLNISRNNAIKGIKPAKSNVESSVSPNNQVIFDNSLEKVDKISLNNSTDESLSGRMNISKVNKEPVINDLNSSQIGGTENVLQSCPSERKSPSNQKEQENKATILIVLFK